jgi:hypothetical protein
MQLQCSLTTAQQVCYDGAVAEWRSLRQAIVMALERLGGGQDVWKAFWATQQRFFKMMCVSLKVMCVTD